MKTHPAPRAVPMSTLGGQAPHKGGPWSHQHREIAAGSGTPSGSAVLGQMHVEQELAIPVPTHRGRVNMQARAGCH